jgi:dienelactone hydrolase
MAAGRRDEVWFTSGGERCAGWWYEPDGQWRSGCAIVMANGFSLTRHDGLPRYARELAAAGHGVLLFDHRYLGDSGGGPRQRFRIGEQREDWRNAIAWAQAQTGVERIALHGYSFAGGHVVRIAAERDDLAAAIALCPFVDGLKRVLATSPRSIAWVAPRALADVAGRHNLIPATGPPRGHAAMAFAGEAEGFAAAVEPGSPWRNEISPGILATVAFHRPVTRARRIRCPLWVGLAERDVTVDRAAAERLAARAPRGELHSYPLDHFEPLTAPAAAGIAADQVAFLNCVL